MTITDAAHPLAESTMSGTMADGIVYAKLSSLTLPLEVPISDAKVLTGRSR